MPLILPKREPFQQILTALQKKSPRNVQELAKELNMSNRTVKRYVEIIIYIQSAPQIEWVDVDKDATIRMRKDNFKWHLWEPTNI